MRERERGRERERERKGESGRENDTKPSSFSLSLSLFCSLQSVYLRHSPIEPIENVSLKNESLCSF